MTTKIPKNFKVFKKYVEAVASHTFYPLKLSVKFSSEPGATGINFEIVLSGKGNKVIPVIMYSELTLSATGAKIYGDELIKRLQAALVQEGIKSMNT
jgi:hypothetical protein